MPAYPKDEGTQAAKWVLSKMRPGMKIGYLKMVASVAFKVSESTITRAIRRQTKGE